MLLQVGGGVLVCATLIWGGSTIKSPCICSAGFDFGSIPSVALSAHPAVAVSVVGRSFVGFARVPVVSFELIDPLLESQLPKPDATECCIPHSEFR